MSEIPDTFGGFDDPNAEDFMNTLQGLCEESVLSRAEILGCLEGVKMALFVNWRDETGDDYE